MTRFISFDNSYARLPDRFYARLDPTPAPKPRLIRLNNALARELGLEPGALADRVGVEILTGNRTPEGAEPLAMAYAGHQFGGWVPQLGDGRAILLGEVIDRKGRRRDIQLKGSGQTPFSRMGDGLSPLGPVLREYIVSEAMAAFGVPTTRALAAVATGRPVARETMLPGGVLTRVAASHVRVGTFQFFTARRDVEALRMLADHVIERHDPMAAEQDNPYLALLEGVIARQAQLIARWMGLGFVHGVMNTDNMTISGETIDYGPCAFMDAYHPDTVFSSIDQFGRYAYKNQPGIAQWNLACLAQSVLPLISEDKDAAIAAAQAAINAFPDVFLDCWASVMRHKIGLGTAEEGDVRLIEDLLERMAANGADFTLTFRRLADAVTDEARPAGVSARDLFRDQAALDGWIDTWRSRLASENRPPAETRAEMLAVNPMFIPRNHLVEEAIAAAYRDDFAPFHALVDVLSRPFEEQQDRGRYAEPARPEEVVHQTFCGT